MIEKTEILGISVDMVTMDEAVDLLTGWLDEGQPRLVVTPNAEIVWLAKRDQELADILNGADLVVPDGAGLVWASKRGEKELRERVTGIDLAYRLLSVASEKGSRVFLFGAKEEISNKASESLRTLFPELELVGRRNGYYSLEDEPDIIREINQAKPDLLLVGLGAPKQEKWLAKYLPTLEARVCMGVGGSFDVFAGAINRAPVWMQKTGLEWLYRLVREPARFKRMLALPKFVWAVIRDRGGTANGGS